jgi:hypothetical protein
MKRRSLLLLSTLLGSLAPLRLLAQEPSRRVPAKSSRTRRDDELPRTARSRLRDDEADPQDDNPPPAAADRDEIPPNLPTEVGHQWRNFDISKYTGLPHKENNPQSSIIDWIFRRTTTAPWHGEKIAILAAGRSKLRVYHNAKILDQVAEVVERFVDAQGDFLTLKIRVVGAADTRWRYTVYKRLNLISAGPQGQQVWTADANDSAQILSLMQLTQGARLHAERKFEMVNGQTLNMVTSSPRAFTGGIQRDSAVAQGYQPKTEELEEGVTLKISPLLSFEGDTIDAAVVLTTNNVRTFHQTRVLAPREVGPGELRVDVPEVSETQLNQTIKGWPIGKTLIISAGIQPGILQQKGGLFNMRIPGTVPTSTEVLVFIDVELAEDSSLRKPDRGRSRR